MEAIFAALLDLLADDLGFEIEQLAEENEALDVTSLWYIQEQMVKYCEWLRAGKVGKTRL